MSALQKTLAVIAFLILASQTIRHAYLLWFEPRGSVLDKYDRPLKNEITQAATLEELVRRYEPVRKEVDAARQELVATGKTVPYEEGARVEPYKSEKALREAINEWEERSKEIRSLWFYWLIGLAFVILGLFIYQKLSRWFGLTLVIAGFAEFIYWTSPTFLGSGTREFDRLLATKLALSLTSFFLLLLVIWFHRIFADSRGQSAQ